jgi:hypothetical protein
VSRGQPTRYSFPTTLGELTITEFHGLGHKLLIGADLFLIVYTYQQRLNFVLASSASLFKKEEAELFMDVVAEVMSDINEALEDSRVD